MPLPRPTIVFQTLCVLVLCTKALQLFADQPEQINGKWIATSIVSTGVVGERYWERVSPLQDSVVVINESVITFSEGYNCTISGSTFEVWTNYMRTFGSFGGNWEQLNLEMTAPNEFGIYLWPITCPEPDQPKLTIVTQPNDGAILLGSHRVFVTLQPHGN